MAKTTEQALLGEAPHLLVFNIQGLKIYIKTLSNKSQHCFILPHPGSHLLWPAKDTDLP